MSRALCRAWAAKAREPRGILVMVFLRTLLMVEIIRFPVRSNATGTLGGNHSDREEEDATGAADDDSDDEEIHDDDEDAADNDDDNDEETDDDDCDVVVSRESDIPEPSQRLLRGPCTRSAPALVTADECKQNGHGARGAVERLAPGTTCAVSPRKSSTLDAVGDLLASAGSLSAIIII